MITLRKLSSLPSGTRLRKCLRLLEEFEKELGEGRLPESDYLSRLLALLHDDLESGTALGVAARARGSEGDLLREEAARASTGVARLRRMVEAASGERELLRGVNEVRHALLSLLGMEPGEWDLLSPGDARRTEAGARPVEGGFFDIALYLEEIRSPFNLGSIARSAEAFGAAGLILSAGVPKSEHPRAQRAAMGAFEELPVARCDDVAGRGEGVAIFALELGGTPISEFSFPRRGVCLLGSEELGLSPGALALADRSWGRCTIPLHGSKGSLNVGVAAGILLARWSDALVADKKKGPAESRQDLFDALLREFSHGLR